MRAQAELGWVILGQLAAGLGGFVAIKVLTNLLGPAAYGQLALGITIAGLVQMFVYGPIDQTVLRFVSVHRERGSLGVFIAALKRVHRLAACLVIPTALLAAVAVYFLANGEWSWLVLSSCLFGIASGFYGTFVSLHNAFRQRRVVTLHQGIDVWLRMCFAVIAVTMFSRTGSAALIGYFLAASVMAASIVYFSLKLPVLKENWGIPTQSKETIGRAMRELVEFGRPFIYFAAFGIVSAYADRWIVFGVLGVEAVGRYAAIYQLANAPVVLAVGMMNQFVVPVIYDRAGGVATAAQSMQSTQLLYQVIGVFSTIMFIMVGAAYLFSESLVGLITAPEFVAYHHLLWIVVMGVGTFQMAQMFTLKGFSHNKTSGYVTPKLLQAGALVLLLLLLANVMGIIGVAWALFGSSLVYLCAVLWVNRSIGQVSGL
ncbi:MAG: oligosaccharide flippase family protein [Nitrospirae bacterium]|nr:oligosaccharide flippase family protein [Nitrospirota bacterium]